jgi:hypothetical protein
MEQVDGEIDCVLIGLCEAPEPRPEFIGDLDLTAHHENSIWGI